MFLQFLFNGIILGATYALAALGFALIYNTTKIFHISYAVLYMFSPYMMLTFNKELGLPMLLAFFIAVILTIILSVLIELAVYRPLDKKGSSSNIMMISSIGVMIIVVNLIAMFYGNETRILNTEISKTLQFGNIVISYTQLYQIILAAILVLMFFVLIKHTSIGVLTRAIRDDKQLCGVFGVDVQKYRLILFALSGFFAAVAGGITAYDMGMDPYVGMPMLLNAVVALIIGGIGRFEAPILGGLVLGVLQSMTVWAFSSRWQDAITFLLLILFLLFRPQGILGGKQRIV